MNKLKMESKNMVDVNIERIGKLFPNVIVESDKGKSIDFDLLKQELSREVVDDGKEKYELTWPGKKESVVEANTPTKNTLIPEKDKSVDFDNTKNIYIEGDNLEALKILQNSYLGKIKCIYIDPPYNTGTDFIYKDNFKKDSNEELEESGQVDDDGNKLVANSQSNGRFHSDWLSMIYSRLKLARNLLTKDGIIFISIDNNELYNLKKVCDEIFGEENFICNFIRTTRKGGGSMSKYVSTDNDYCLMYAKNISSVKRFFVPFEKKYLKRYSEKDELGRFFWDTFARNRQGSSNNYTITAPDGTELNSAWIYQKDKFEELYTRGDIRIKKTKDGWSVQCKQRLNEQGQIMRSQLNDFTNEMGTKEMVELLGRDIFTYAKPTELIKYLINSVISKEDIVLDFFSGSATTAHAVMQLNAEDAGNRKYIMIQVPEKISKDSKAYKAGYKTICDIGEERIRRAGKKIKEKNPAEIDYGFKVFRIDSSNIKDNFYKKSNDLDQSQLKWFESNIKDDRTSDDLLTQVMLDLGLTLDLKVEKKKIEDDNVYFVENNSIIACFDDTIDFNIIEKLASLKPLRAVFKDESFESDNDKINLEEKFKKLSPETELMML